MYNPERFFSAEFASVEDELELTKQIFPTGTWRLNEYYERMGLPRREKAGSPILGIFTILDKWE
jgi:hypothetical protein